MGKGPHVSYSPSLFMFLMALPLCATKQTALLGNVFLSWALWFIKQLESSVIGHNLHTVDCPSDSYINLCIHILIKLT